MDIKNTIQFFKSRYNLLTILGPTATGKTFVASNLAKLIDGEIISADSRQVYRNMDLGTGKDLEDYTISGFNVPYHLIDIANAGERYNLFNYFNDFFQVFEKINIKGKIPIMCGGTGLYIESIIRNFDLKAVPENPKLRTELETKTLEELTSILTELKKLHNKTDIDTKKRAIRAIEIELYNKKNEISEIQRPNINSLNIGIKFDRNLQVEKITQRLKKRLETGMIEEVKSLIDKGISTDTLIYYGLEYKFITQYLLGQFSYDQMFNALNIAIHQFSKRQMTFFRHMEKQNVKINWIDGLLPLEEKLNQIFILMQS